MHFATELAEFYMCYNGGVLTWYTLLIGWVLHGLLSLILFNTVKDTGVILLNLVHSVLYRDL